MPAATQSIRSSIAYLLRVLTLPPHAVLMFSFLQASLHDPASHKYCLKSGTVPLLQAAVDWFDRTYGVKLDPETQALSLVGSQEGLAHLLMAVTDPGDGIFMTDVAYPSYFGAGEGVLKRAR
jgi:aspartate/methionine/tyrosine aminotransferase